MRVALRWIPVAAILAFPVAARAQMAATSVKLGLIGGANFSDMTGDQIEGHNFKMGFDVGLTLQKPINDMWSFNAEAHYTSKGVKASNGNDITLGINYIEVPLLFRGGASSGMVKPFFELGAAPAVKVMCDLAVVTNGVDVGEDCDKEKELNSFDIGLVGGAGLEWTAMGHPWTLGARYTYGLMKVAHAGSWANATDTNIQFLLGFRFR